MRMFWLIEVSVKPLMTRLLSFMMFPYRFGLGGRGYFFRFFSVLIPLVGNGEFMLVLLVVLEYYGPR